jgi:competence protein ComEC
MPHYFLFLNFWNHHPALFFGLSFLLGLYSRLSNPLYSLFPLLCLHIPYLIACVQKDKRALKILSLSLLIFSTAWVYAAAQYTFPTLPTQGIQGNARVEINNLSFQHSLFGGRWLYRCELAQFIPKNESKSIAYALPCLIILTEEQVQRHSRPLANQNYWVEGRLIQSSNGSYLLKVSAKTQWIPIENTWSLAEQRFAWKRALIEWIQKTLPNPLSANFLAGLATGEFDDHWMRQQFSRFGLQHLLAISGFHFAILASFISFAFSLFLSHRGKNMGLLVILGIYCLFLGPQAPVLRAWLMCSLTYIGFLLEKQTTALNSLGIALFGILGFNPLLCLSLGFQLSFAITVSILLFYQPARAAVNELLPKQHLSDVMQMNLSNQHGYCVAAFLRGMLALTVAVNVFALPFTLYYFNTFPWMSLLYNLFFPLLTSFSLCLLIIGALFSIIPFLGQGIHTANSAYTEFLLRLTYQIPTEIDAYLVVDPFDSLWLIIYLSLTSLAGIWWREKMNLQEEQLAFI